MLMISVFYGISLLLPINNWIEIFVSIIVCGTVGILINSIVMLGKEDKKIFIRLLKNKLGLK